MTSSLREILANGSLAEKKAVFLFDRTNGDELVLLKFDLWARYLQPQYFESQDAPFHEQINLGNLHAYRGSIDYFVDIAFRGAGKDVKTKLFIAFCILNDQDRLRRYYKILSADLDNAKQTVTDIYNILVNYRVAELYPDTFVKTQYKREETMESFTTAHGIKILADTVGTEQRGAIQGESRPDFVWMNDFETRKTLRSAVVTRAIWDNMEEARTGLQKGGCCVYTCNYISEQGNVHRLVTDKKSDRKRVLKIPIVDEQGRIAWSRYTPKDIEQMKKDDDDFEGERLCKPSASKDAFFDRESLDEMPKIQPIRDIAGFKIYREYNPSHRLGSGHDVAGGVGLDSSTSVFIDFDVVPAQVVATFASNTIKPDVFGDEIVREADYFGRCLNGIECNKYDQAVLRARQLGANLYAREGKATKIDISPPKEYGWLTTSLTKPKMLFAFAKAIEDGLIELNDPDLIEEAKAFTRNDLMDREVDPRLITTATRHFDLLVAACIAWQMKDHATVTQTATPKRQRLKVKSTKWGL